MQSHLEQKEEEISKKDYVNKKLNNQLQNKTANIKQEPFLLNKVFVHKHFSQGLLPREPK